MTLSPSILVVLLAAAPAAAASVTVPSLMKSFPTRAEALAAIGPAGPERVVAALEQFRTEGWAILPPGTGISPAIHAEIALLAKSALPPEARRQTLSNPLPLHPGRESEGSPALRQAFASLKLLVLAGMPGEEARFAETPSLASVLGEHDEANEPHADYGGYWNSTYALNHSGTRLFPIKDGRVREVIAPVRRVVLISAEDRYRAAGVRPIVHAAPAGRLTRRDVVKFGGDNEEFDLGFRFTLPPELRLIPAIQADVARVKAWLKSRGRKR